MKNNETGRSMVEMLGVLAIIGVLSVAGIAGYTMAMRKYRANEIAEAISMLAVAVNTTNAGEGITSTTSYETLFNQNNPSGATKLEANVTNGVFDKTLTVELDSEPLCNAVADNFGTSGSLTAAKSCQTDPHTLTITVND